MEVKEQTEVWLNKTAILALGIIFVFVILVFFAKPIRAINQQITFQGKLTNTSGYNVANGTYYVKLTIYDAATGGNCQYSATSSCASVTSTPVTVTSGIFSVNLGDTSASLAALPATLFNAPTLYLGITVCSGPGVGCDSEMTPRKRITAAPYAFSADYLGGVTTSTAGGDGSYIPATDSSGNLRISHDVFVATSTGGQLGVGTSTVPSGVKTYIESTTASDKMLVIRGQASQTGVLTEWQTNTAAFMASLSSSTVSLLAGNQQTQYDGISGFAHLIVGNASGLGGAITLQAGTTITGAGDTDRAGLFIKNSAGAVRAQLHYADGSGYLHLAGSSTTSSLDSASLTIGKNSSTYLQGIFYVDSSGNVSGSGTLAIAGHFTPYTDNLYDIGSSSTQWRYGNFQEGLLVGNGSATSTFDLTQLYINQGGTSSSLLTGSSLTLGRGTNYMGGVFRVDSTGAISSSGSLFIGGGAAPLGSVTKPVHKDSFSSSTAYSETAASKVNVAGNYLYVLAPGAGPDSLQIFDISSSSLVFRGVLFDDVGGALLNGVTDMRVAGNYAYVVSTVDDALEIIDISNPASPAHKGSIVTGAGGAQLTDPRGLDVSGNYAYIAADGSNALEIVDISNPANPVHKGSISDGGASPPYLDYPYDVYVKGKYAYVIDYTNSALNVIDVSNPSSPVYVSSVTGLTNAIYLDVSGNYAYVSNATNIFLVDISNPTNPVKKTTISNGGGGGILLSSVRKIFVSGHHLYAPNWNGSLEIIDVSDPLNPRHSGLIMDGEGGAVLTGAVDVTVSGNYAYVVSQTDSAIEVVDVSGAFIPNVEIGNLLADDLQVLGPAYFDRDLFIQTGLSVAGNTLLMGDVTLGGGLATSTVSSTLSIHSPTAVGARATGNAMLFITASSTTAVPLLVHDDAGGVLLRIASSTDDAIYGGVQTDFNGLALLTLGDSGGRTGVMDIKNAGALVVRAAGTNQTVVQLGNRLGATGGEIILGTGAATSTLDGQAFILGQASSYNLGKFYVDSSGNTSTSGTLFTYGAVGIATTTATVGATNYKLLVDANGSTNAGIGVLGYIKATGLITQSTSLDLAEKYPIDPACEARGDCPEAGDVVAVKDSEGGALSFYIHKAALSDDEKIIGIVSTQPGFLLEGGLADLGTRNLTLAGRVPVKVSAENGIIRVSDKLVISSSTPGVAAKYLGSGTVVGMALENYTSVTPGKIVAYISLGWDRPHTNQNTNINTNEINTNLIDNPQNPSDLNTQNNSSGQLVQQNLDMGGYSILNVKSVAGKDGKWEIDENGWLINKLATTQGEKKVYGVASESAELNLSGSGQLANGEARIELATSTKEVISTSAPIKVSVTLTAEARGVYVAEKGAWGFVVKELNGGASDATFDWVVIARRKTQSEIDMDSTNLPAEEAGAAVSTNLPAEEADDTNTTSTLPPPPYEGGNEGGIGLSVIPTESATGGAEAEESSSSTPTPIVSTQVSESTPSTSTEPIATDAEN